MGAMTLEDKIRERYSKLDLIRRRFPVREAEGESESPSLVTSTDSGKYRGLAVPFNSVTRINDFWDGDFDEQFLPGSFTETLATKRVTLLFEHGYNTLIDRMPMGSFDEIEETERGLEFVATPFDNWLTQPVRDAVSAGVIDQMSIGFRAQDFDIEEQDDDDGVPLVSHSRAELPEMSIVLWAAYEDTELSLNSKQFGKGPAPADPTVDLTRGEDASQEQSKPRKPRFALAKAKLILQELT